MNKHTNSIDLNGIFELLENSVKILIITPTLNLNSNAAKLYYILRNSKYSNKVFCNDTICYDQDSKTRIKEHFVNKGISNLKEECIITHYKSITSVMKKEHLFILSDTLNRNLTDYIVNEFDVKYIFRDNIDITPQLRLECRDDNYFRLHHNSVRPQVKKRCKYFIFDTETNGLPDKLKYRCVPYTDEHGWRNCRMLSIAWLVVDENLNVINSYYTLIKNENIENRVTAQLINKIEDKYRNETGIYFNDMMTKLFEDVEDCSYIVSHGTDFDFNLLISECIRYEVNPLPLKDKIVLNTKQNLWKENYKLGLSDIVSVDINKYPEIETLEAHNALYDCYLCLELLKIRLRKCK